MKINKGRVYKKKMRHKRNWNRLLCALLACSMILPANVLPVNAAKSEREGVTEEVVEIGSDQWETPIIPRAPKAVKVVEETKILLNETT